MSDRWSRWTSLTGALFGVLIIVGFFSGSETPEPNASAARVYAYYAAHISSTETSALIIAAAVIVFVIWAAVLAAYLRESESARGAEVLLLPGAAILAVGALTLAAIEFGIAHYLHNLGPETARTLNIITDIAFLPLLAGGFLYALGSGIAIVRGAALPRWLGWVAIVIGIAALVPPAGFFALLALAIWSLVVSILMFVRLRRPAVSTSAVPQPAT